MNKYATTPQGQYHGPLPVRNFFPLPNIIFDLGLTAEEIAVYAFLMKCEDRRTYTCYPSYKTIGDAIGKSRNTVIKYVNMLEEKELITKRKSFVITKDGKAWNGNLIFKISVERQSDFQDSASQKRAGCLLLSADVETKEYPVFQAGKAP